MKGWQFRLVAWLWLLSVLVGCSGYDSYEYLEGKFIAKDLTPVDLLEPTQGSTVSVNPKFTWSRRSGARAYWLQVSDKSDFSSLLVNKRATENDYQLINSDLMGITQLSSMSYYWRVSAEYADLNILSRQFLFHILPDRVVYVNVGSPLSEEVGNITFPYKSIQAGVNSASIRRNFESNIAFSVFVAKGSYTEEIYLPAGVSILGGYEASAWTRNISANVTSITAKNSFAIFCGADILLAYQNTTIIDGFSILGTALNGYAIYVFKGRPIIQNNSVTLGNSTNNTGIYNNAAAPLIQNNTISGGSGTGTNYGIYNSASTPTILANVIHGGVGTDNFGIYNTSTSTATISGNTITGGTLGGLIVGNNYGIYNSSSSPAISRNSINGGSGGILGSNIYGIYNASSSATISNNIIMGGSGGGSNLGIYIVSSSPTISNNTINGGSTGIITAIALSSNSTPSIRNNVIFASAGMGACVYETAAGDDPTIFQNNNLFGCSTMYYDFDSGCGGGTNCSLAQLNLLSGAGGNVSINNAGNQLFLNQNGPDGNADTMADNDWHLTTNAAICNVRGGGLTISGITLDKDGVTRTTDNPSGGCVPANAGATGWSMGAYESN